MKIRKLSKYEPPRYPTLGESREMPQILERVPCRWMSQPLAKLLGAGLFAQTLVSCSGDDNQRSSDEVIQISPDAQNIVRQQKAASQIKRLATTVAPFLQDAMASDGRGTFGCVATDPPVYLAENEAIEVIKNELRKAGLNLTDTFKVEQIQAPAGNDPDKAEKELFGKHEFIYREGVKFETMDFFFDLGDETRSIAVEFLSLRDYDYWTGEPRSTAPSYNFPVLAEKLRKLFEERHQGKPVTIGLFFDPLVHHGSGTILPLEGLDEQQKAFVRQQARQEREATASAKNRAHDKLVLQVRHFVEYLRKDGVLPKE